MAINTSLVYTLAKYENATTYLKDFRIKLEQDSQSKDTYIFYLDDDKGWGTLEAYKSDFKKALTSGKQIKLLFEDENGFQYVFVILSTIPWDELLGATTV